MSNQLQTQTELYAQIGQLFRSGKSGHELLMGLLRSMQSFSDTRIDELQKDTKEFLVKTTCEFAILSWGRDPLGALGAKEYKNLTILADPDDPDSEDELLTIHDPDKEEETERRIKAYNESLRDTHNKERCNPTLDLHSLSKMHSDIVNAPFWVFGYPDRTAKKQETPSNQESANSDSLNLAMMQNYELKVGYAKDDEFHEERWRTFQHILATRYFDSPRKENDNLYYVPKYSQVEDKAAQFACQCIVGFTDVSEATFRYLQKAINLFMDLLLTHLGTLVNFESIARGVATSVENRGFAHNLNYVVHAPKDSHTAQISAPNPEDALALNRAIIEDQKYILRYLAARQSYIASRAWGRRLPFHLVPVGELTKAIHDDREVFSTLLQVTIAASVHKYNKKIEKGFVGLPGGREAINAIRNILENIVRNIAKHSHEDTVSRIVKENLLRLNLTIEKAAPAKEGAPDEVALQFCVDGYDATSFERISEKLNPGELFLIDGVTPSQANRGILEMLLCGMTLQGVPVEWLRDKDSLEVVFSPAGENPEATIFVKDPSGRDPKQRIFQIKVGHSSQELIHRFFLKRIVPILAVESSDPKRAKSQTDSIYSSVGLDHLSPSLYRGELFILVPEAQSEDPRFRNFLGWIPRPRVSYLSDGLKDVEDGTELLARLWMERIHDASIYPYRQDGIPHIILIVGMPQWVRHLDDLLDIVQAPSLASEIPGYGVASEIAKRPECVAILSHSREIPNEIVQEISHFGNYRGPLVEGFKDSNDIRRPLANAGAGQASQSELNQIWEYIEAAPLRILIIDERLPKLFGNRSSNTRANCAGLPDLTFQESWALQGVDLSVSLNDIRDLDESKFASYDFVLVHDGWWRGAIGAAAAAVLQGMGDSILSAKVIVHSDGDTFQTANGGANRDLFCLRWTDLLNVLETETKIQLLQLIQKAKRYSRRSHLSQEKEF